MKLSARIPLIAIGQEILVRVDFGENLMAMVQVSESDRVEFDVSEKNTTVRWANGGAGTFGVQFKDLKPETLALIRRIIAQYSNATVPES